MIDLPLVESNPLYWLVDQTIDQNTPGSWQDRVRSYLVKSYLLAANDLLPGIAE